MKNKFIAAGILVLALVAMPYFVFATSNPINSNVFNPTILAGPLVICTGVASSAGGASFPACNNLCDLVAQIANVIYFFIAVVIWIIAPILIAVGGIMIMLAGPNPEMLGRGKKTITGAIWGIVIVLLAWLIIFTFVSILGIKGVGGFGTSACSIAPAPANNNYCAILCGSVCCSPGQACSSSNQCVTLPTSKTPCPSNVMCGGVCCATGQTCAVSILNNTQSCANQ
jgi:Type IV secretion system pilin